MRKSRILIKISVVLCIFLFCLLSNVVWVGFNRILYGIEFFGPCSLTVSSELVTEQIINDSVCFSTTAVNSNAPLSWEIVIDDEDRISYPQLIQTDNNRQVFSSKQTLLELFSLLPQDSYTLQVKSGRNPLIESEVHWNPCTSPDLNKDYVILEVSERVYEITCEAGQ